jgi:hypothetical protein
MVELTLGGVPVQYPMSLSICHAAFVHYFETSDLNADILAI